MEKKGVLNRDITKKECPWLKRNLKKGEVVYKAAGYCYGCITPSGVAVKFQIMDKYNFEVPKNAVDWR